MRVAIGTSSPVEVEAAREAWKVFSASLMEDPRDKVEFLHYGVGGSLSRLPLSVSELMEGAQSRAESLILQLKRERNEADYYIGLQAGFNIVNSQGPRRLVFLESWAYVSDGHRGSFGHSGGIVVPSRISDPVIDRGIELGIILDRFSAEQRMHSEQGPWGLLTREILSSKHSFVIALISAFAPFYNAQAFNQ